MLPVPHSLVPLCLLLGIIARPAHFYPAPQSPVASPRIISAAPPQRRHAPPPTGVIGGTGVTPMQSYGVLIRNAPLWPQPANVQPATRQVPQGVWVWIVGQKNGFYATILANGMQGWLSCSAVKLGAPLPSGGTQIFGVTTVDDSLYLQPAIQAVLKGSRVRIVGKRGDFYAVILENGRQGWVTSKKVQLTTPPLSESVRQAYGIVTADSQLWPQPSVALQPVPKGTRVQIIGQQGDCYNAILKNGRQGWLRCDEVQLDTYSPSRVVGQSVPPTGVTGGTTPINNIIVNSSSSSSATVVVGPTLPTGEETSSPSDMTSLPNGVFSGTNSPSEKVTVTPPNGELLHNTNLWQQPTRASRLVIQAVLKGSQLQIIGAQGEFYAVILENGRRGWLLRNAVQLITVLPSGVIEGADLPSGPAPASGTAPSSGVTTH